MERNDTQLIPLGASDARRIYDVMCVYREFDTSSATKQSFDSWLVNSFPLQQFYQWTENGYATFASIGNIDWIDRSATFGVFSEMPGRGHGFRAGLALLAHAFDSLGLNRLSCNIRSDNERCIAAISKYPAAVHEGTFRGALYRSGRFVNMEIFAILADDWRAQNG